MYDARLQSVRTKLAVMRIFDKIARVSGIEGYSGERAPRSRGPVAYEHLLPIRRVPGGRSADGNIEVLVTGARGEDLGRMRMPGHEYVGHINTHAARLEALRKKHAGSGNIDDVLTQYTQSVRDRKLSRLQLEDKIAAAKYKTIGSIRNLIKSMKKGPLAGYAETLVGPRTRGSMSVLGLNKMMAKTPLTEFRPAAGVAQEGVRYFRARIPGLGGRLGAIPYSEAVAKNLTIRERVGKHGAELFLNRAPNLKNMKPVDYATFIVGKEKGKDVLFTWHPGMPLGTMKDGINPFTAVKTHFGS